MKYDAAMLITLKLLKRHPWCLLTFIYYANNAMLLTLIWVLNKVAEFNYLDVGAMENEGMHFNIVSYIHVC